MSETVCLDQRFSLLDCCISNLHHSHWKTLITHSVAMSNPCGSHLHCCKDGSLAVHLTIVHPVEGPFYTFLYIIRHHTVNYTVWYSMYVVIRILNQLYTLLHKHRPSLAEEDKHSDSACARKQQLFENRSMDPNPQACSFHKRHSRAKFKHYRWLNSIQWLE